MWNALACPDVIMPYIWFTHPEFHIKITRQLINGLHWSNTGPWPQYTVQPHNEVCFYNNLWRVYIVGIWETTHGQFSPKYTQYTPNSLPMGSRYGLLFVRPQCGFYFTFVIQLLWTISSHTEQCSVFYRAWGLVPKVSENSKFVWDLPNLQKKLEGP